MSPQFISLDKGAANTTPMDGSYQLLAARYVRKQTRQLIGQLDGVREADDIEFVHQARVASRRLRAALRIFRNCFAGKKVKRWCKQIRRLTEGLGPARDKDVQIEFVSSVLSGLEDEAHRPGIARLLLRLQQSRRAIQSQAIKAVDRLEKSGVAGQMLAAAKRMLSELKKRDLSVRSPFAVSQAEEHVLNRLGQLMEYEDCLGDPQDHRQHHAMRIVAKRLRYTMEICSPVYEGRLDEFIRAVKSVQSLLGDIHDCDVWVENLAAFVEEERERTLTYYGHGRPFRRLEVGLEYLRQERQVHRNEVFRQLVEHWQALNQAALWERLVRTVQLGPDPPVGSEPAGGGPVVETGTKLKSPLDRGDGRATTSDGKGNLSPTAEHSAQPAAPDGRAGKQQATLLGAGGPSRGVQ